MTYHLSLPLFVPITRIHRVINGKSFPVYYLWDNFQDFTVVQKIHNMQIV